MLINTGSKLLITELPSIFDGSAQAKALPQDESKATVAPKITPEESWLSFDQTAIVLHKKVRAFAGWPGTRAKLVVIEPNSDEKDTLELKIITTRVHHNEIQNGEMDDIFFAKGSLIIPCGEGTALELEVEVRIADDPDFSDESPLDESQHLKKMDEHYVECAGTTQQSTYGVGNYGSLMSSHQRDIERVWEEGRAQGHAEGRAEIQTKLDEVLA